MMKLCFAALLLSCVVYSVLAQPGGPATGGKRCRDEDDGRYGTTCCRKNDGSRCCRGDDDSNKCCRSYDGGRKCCNDSDRYDEGYGPKKCTGGSGGTGQVVGGTGGKRCRDEDDGRYGNTCCRKNDGSRCCRGDDDSNKCCSSYDGGRKCCNDNDRYDEGYGPKKCSWLGGSGGTGGKRCRDEDDGRYGNTCCRKNDGSRCCRGDDDSNKCCRSYDGGRKCCNDSDRYDEGYGPKKCMGGRDG